MTKYKICSQKFLLEFLYCFEDDMMNPAHRFYGIHCTYVLLLLHKRYRRIVALNLFWKDNATQCIWLLYFSPETVQAERRYFLSFSWCAHVQSQGWPAYSSSTPYTRTVHSQMHNSEVFLAFNYSPHQCYFCVPMEYLWLLPAAGVCLQNRSLCKCFLFDWFGVQTFLRDDTSWEIFLK